MKGLSSFDRRIVRKNLCDKYGGCCAYCDVYVGKRGTVDHYLPQSLGGTHDFDNLRWACTSCNNLKGDLPPQEWEMNKPSSHRAETKHENRIRLLSGIAQRGETDKDILSFFAFLFVCILVFLYLANSYDQVHCIEGYKFYRQTQILDAEGRAIRCEGVRPSAGKPLT